MSNPFHTASDAGHQAAIAEASHSGRAATALSAIALLFSGLSYYESALKDAELEFFVPPVIQYGRDGDAEVFMVPITVSNNGSRTGTVLAMELVADNPTADGDAAKSKTFYSAFLGEHPRSPEQAGRAFAPISVPARATYTETIRFYPQGNYFPKLITDKGTFKFSLKLHTAAPSEASVLQRATGRGSPKPIEFERILPFLSEQHVEFRRGTISMHAPDWKPATVKAE